MTDLWPDFSTEEQEPNNSIEILRDQARALEKKTNKLVKATFSKIKYSEMALLKYTQAALETMCLPGAELLDDELQEKSDFNDLFKTTKYKFEIYNDTYRFRVFTLNYCEIFPITISLDSGIGEEINRTTEIVISSNSELTDTLAIIFSSKKVRTVVSRMIQSKRKEDLPQQGKSSVPT